MAKRTKRGKRSTRKKVGGEKKNVKLGILLITTHGNLDPHEEETENNTNVNIRKINATTAGVCNYIEDGELLDMGKKLNEFIIERKNIAIQRGLLESPNNLDMSFESSKLGEQYVDNLSKSIRSYIPKIDGVRKETVKSITGKRKIEPEFIEIDDPDLDVRKYRDNISESYTLTKWNPNQMYLDKTYTIIPEERRDTTANYYNNSILFLGELGEPESITVNMPYNLKSNVNKMNDDGNNYRYIRFSEILEELGNKGYTDVIVIDLSCSAGWDDREGRILTRQSKMQKIIYGGKRRKTKVKRQNKRKQKRTYKKRK